MLTSIRTREFNIIFSGHAIYRQHLADFSSRRFGPKTGPLSSYNKSAYHLTSKFLYISTRYLVLITSIRGMTPMQPRWKKGAHRVSEVLEGGRFHRLSSLRFTPRGSNVPRVLIHRLSLILRRQGSWLWACWMTMTWCWMTTACWMTMMWCWMTMMWCWMTTAVCTLLECADRCWSVITFLSDCSCKKNGDTSVFRGGSWGIWGRKLLPPPPI